jgi:hypothetical protein
VEGINRKNEFRPAHAKKLFKKITKAKRDRSMAQAVEYLPGSAEAQSSTPQ